MASDLDFVEYVCDQMSESGLVSFKKMFGEYAVYYNEQVVALICNNQLFIKPTQGGRALIEQEMNAVVEAAPYPGAKLHFLIGEQLDNRQWLSRLIQQTASELPAPKPKKPKSKKA